MSHENPYSTESSPTKIPLDPRLRITWEVELLISGALVFSLFRVPTALDEVFINTAWHLSANLMILPALLYVYLKLIVYVLITSFLVHLSARGYWVGLLGLNSIFPNGVKWENIKVGPINKKLMQEMISPIPDCIQAANRFCSVIFSISFFVICMFLVSTIWALVLSIPVFLVRHFIPSLNVVLWLYITYFISFLPTVVAAVMDKRMEKKVSKYPALQRKIRSVLRFYGRIFLVVISGPIQVTLFSNIQKKTAYTIATICMVIPFVIFLATALLGSGKMSLHSYRYSPKDPGNMGVNYRYYEDQREAFTNKKYPTIQSDMIQDPYIRLFIPYRPAKDNKDLSAFCPEVEPFQNEGFGWKDVGVSEAETENKAANLACLSKLYEIVLNGQIQNDLEFFFYEQPDDKVRGMICYIPTEPLPKGKNLLLLKRVSPEKNDGEAEDSKTKGDEDPDNHHYIFFWR